MWLRRGNGSVYKTVVARGPESWYPTFDTTSPSKMASETDESSSPMAVLSSDGDEEESIGLPYGKLYPLNS